MKFIHLSDLHLGKRVNEYSMLDEQKFILDKIIDIVFSQKPDGVIIAGDIYDKPVPPAEAVTLFDDLLYSLCKENIKVFAISGNHDSPERTSFACRIMDRDGVYMRGSFDGKITPITLEDEYGKADIFLLPFVRPSTVRNHYQDESIKSYTEAVRKIIKDMDIDPARRNILVTHQFVIGALRSDSEEVSVGGTDGVDAYVFEPFDYTALGHLHSAQFCGSDKIRYCGTPLKYSFAEAGKPRSLDIVELKEKGNLSLRSVILEPLHDMKRIKGSYEELTAKSYYEGTDLRDAFLHITLTDEEDIPEAAARLSVIYRRLLKLSYDNTRTRMSFDMRIDDGVSKTPRELFGEFFKMQTGRELGEKEGAFISALIEEVMEED